MFDKIKDVVLINPYGTKVNEQWKESDIEVDFLMKVYGGYENYKELIENTKSEGLRLFFQDLKEQGILN